MPLEIDPIEQQSNFPIEKKPSLDPSEVRTYADVFSLQNGFRILFRVLDNTFDAIADYVNAIPAGIPEAPEDGQTYGRKDADWVPVTGGGGGVSYIVGAVYGFHPGFRFSATSVQAQTGVGNARGSVIIVPFAGKFKVGWRCSAFVTPTAVRAGLYARRAANSWLPGALVTDLGTLSITASGLMQTSSAVTIPEGVYVLVIFYGTNAGTSNTYVYNNCTPVDVLDGLPEPLYSAGQPPTRFDAAVTYPVGTLPDLTAQAFTVQTTLQAVGPRLIGAT